MLLRSSLIFLFIAHALLGACSGELATEDDVPDRGEVHDDGLAPKISISNPSVLFFQANFPENVRVRNAGDGPLTILSVSLIGVGASHFGITRNFDAEIEAGEFTDFQVEWLGTGGAPAARVEITSNDPVTSQATVDLRVVGGAPRVAISHDPVRFGLVPAGISFADAPRREASLRNIGNAALEISEFYIEQTGDNILFDGDPNHLLPLTLEPSTDELSLTFVCQPETDLPVDAQLVVYSNDSSGAAVPGRSNLYEHSFLIQCNSAAPCIDVRTDGVSHDEATPIDFGATEFGRTSTKQVYVSNCDPRGGDDPLIISQIYIPDEFAHAAYELDLSRFRLPLELGHGEETYFSLMYAPEDTGVEDFIMDETTLRFRSNDEAREVFDVAVEGHGSEF